jgi:hypothetical protein
VSIGSARFEKSVDGTAAKANDVRNPPRPTGRFVKDVHLLRYVTAPLVICAGEFSMTNLLEVLFGCTHKRTTFPMTVARARNGSAANSTNTYVVCLDCGKEFAYDWTQMKLKSSARAKVLTRAA